MGNITPKFFAANPATLAKVHMDDKFRIVAAWILAFSLCIGLFATAYWDLHWGIVPIGK
jgi:hypothetical protein